MTVKSTILNADDRLREAANKPRRSISRPDGGAEEIALRQLGFALARIETGSPFLPSKLLPKPAGSNGPSGASWGPFFATKPSDNPSLFINLDIKDFQRQAGDLDQDEKAGVKTLHRLDEILLHLQRVAPARNPDFKRD